MYRILSLFILSGFISSLKAQENQKQKNQLLGSLVGNVLDNSSGKALPMATVQLLRMDVAVAPQAQVSDKNGGFDFEKLPMGYYRLTIELVGYGKMSMDSIHLYGERTDINLGDIN